MRKKLLSLLVLLMTAATGAWAQRLYLEVNGTAATLKYSANEADYSGKPSFTGTMWQNASGFKASVETITVDASCENFAGDKLQNLFAACATLTSVTGLGTINTTNVTSMQQLFNGCSSLASLDLSGFNTANVTTMQKMFYGCSSLASLDLSGFNTANVTTMQQMFGSCSSLETVDLSSFNTASVTTMKSMFYECSKLETIFVGDDWSTASSTDYMFYNCTSLPNWDDTDDGTKAYYGGDGKGYLTYKPATVILTAGAGVATGEYWATYYDGTTSYTADANTTVYQAAVNSTKDAVVLTPVTDNEIPAGKAVILKSSASTITLTPAMTTQKLEGNELLGFDAATTAPANAYCLTKGDLGIGFYKYPAGTDIPAHRAYIVIASGTARGFYGFGEEEMTSLNTIDNGQLTIDNMVYDLQGRRVSQPTKGLYIVNGKKIIIK